MKQIKNTLIYAILFAFFFTPADVSARSGLKDSDFKRIVEGHKKHYKGEKTAFYFRLFDEEKEIPKDARKFLVISASELLSRKKTLEYYFEEEFYSRNSRTTLLLDVKKGDGLVDKKGCFKLTKNNLPSKLKALWISNTHKDVLSTAPDFLRQSFYLYDLTFTDFDAFQEFGFGFLYDVEMVKTLNISGFKTAKILGESFLSGCKRLQKIDLSDYTEIKTIGNFFLSRCHSLIEVNLSGPEKAIKLAIGNDFLNENYRLKKVLNPEATHPRLLAKAIYYLRESDNVAQQTIGAEYYYEHILKKNLNLDNLRKPFNLNFIHQRTPKKLLDIKMDPDEVIVEYDKLLKDIGYVNKYDHITSNSYLRFLRPQLHDLFVEDNLKIRFRIKERDRHQMKIAFKHLITAFRKMVSNPEDIHEAKVYIDMLLQGFENCQSRYVGVINNVMLKFNMGQREEEDLEGKLWNLMNRFKMRSFMKFIAEEDHDTDIGAHTAGRKFTIIHEKLNLPVAVRCFQENISTFMKDKAKSAEIIAETEADFLRDHFTVEKMVDFYDREFKNECFPYTPAQLRGLLGRKEKDEILAQFESEDLDDFDRYYLHWADLTETSKFDYDKTPFTKGEIKRLLTLIGALNEVENNGNPKAKAR